MPRFRRARPFHAAAAGLALLALLAPLALGACNDTPVFERESATAEARLSVPASLTPPVDVRGIAGAPAEWKLAERVADALRSRDIPASALTRRPSAFVLQGQMRPRNGRVEVAWSLYDGAGKKAGDVTQIAAALAPKAMNGAAVAAIAEAAAERIAPLVPSSSLPSDDTRRVSAVAVTTSAPRDLVRPANGPSKPLPPPQSATRESVETAESPNPAPVPAYDTVRPAAPPSGIVLAQHAEAPTPRSDVQYAERAARATYQFWVQVGSHKDEATARAEWQKIQGTVEATAPNSGNRIQRADLGARGIYYRLQVGPFASAGEAGQLCARLKARAVECFLAPPEPVTASVRPPVEPPPKPVDIEPQPKPVAKPAEPKPAAKPPEPKPVAKPVEPKPPEAKPTPAEKPKDAAAVPKQPETETPALPDVKQPRNPPGPAPDAPISTTPGLPGVLD